MEIPNLVPKLNPAFNWEPMEDGCLVYSPDGAQILTLNVVAELILSHCDGLSSLPAIYQQFNADAPLEPSAFMETVNILIREKVLLAGPS